MENKIILKKTNQCALFQHCVYQNLLMTSGAGPDPTNKISCQKYVFYRGSVKKFNQSKCFTIMK